MPSCASVDWKVVDVEAIRQSDLRAQFEFDALVEQIAIASTIVDFRKELGTHEAKGTWRPTFVLQLSRHLFDRFFNNPCGYRGLYLASPKLGVAGNMKMVNSLASRLLSSVPVQTTGTARERIQESLFSPAAKMWMDEDQHDPFTPELRVQIQVPSWIAAATAAYERLKSADPITPKEVDRIFGVRAPCGTRLKVFGAWVGATGVLPAVPSKQDRAMEIHSFGGS